MRLIDADALVERINEDVVCCNKDSIGECIYLDAIESVKVQPTVDPESLRLQSRWIWKDDEPDNYECICSNCNAEEEHLYPYCPYCGAKMDLEVG